MKRPTTSSPNFQKSISNRECLTKDNPMKTVLIIALAALATTASAQNKNNDFGLDFSVEAEKRIVKNLDLGIEAGMRTQDNTQRMERVSLGANLEYKFLDTKTFDMKAFTGFEYIWSNKLGHADEHYNKSGDMNGYNIYDHYWRNRHRTSFGLSATYSPSKRWSFTLKETMQYNHYCADSVTREKWRYNDDDEPYLKETDQKAVDAKDRWVLRSKLTVEYNIKGAPLNPFASIDYGRGFNYNANKWKLSVGCNWKIDKQNHLAVFYRYQTENDDDEPDGHIFGIGYKIKF